MSNLSIATNDDNDIYLDSSGNLAMVMDEDAVKQDCEHAMKAQLGEMFIQPTSGMPTREDVFSNNAFIKWEVIGRRTLANIAGVQRVKSFTVTIAGDQFFYVAEIITVYSPTILIIQNTFG